MKNFFKGMDSLTSAYEEFSHAVEKVRNNFPSLWGLAGEACAMAEVLATASATAPIVLNHENGQSLIGIWNRIRKYQQNAFILLVGEQVDEGLAVLRMAAELTFILKASAASPRNLKLWIEHGSPRSQSFKEAAMMDLENPTQKRIYGLYKYCSRYGVHSHISSELYTDTEDNVAQASDYGASIFLKIWLVNFVPIHRFAFDLMWKAEPFEGIEEWNDEINQIEMKLLKATQTEGYFR